MQINLNQSNNKTTMKTKNILTKEEIEKLISDKKELLAIKKNKLIEAAEKKYNKSVKALEDKYLASEARIKKSKSKKERVPLTTEKSVNKKEISKLYKAGKTHEEIAQHLEITEELVVLKLKSLGLIDKKAKK
jgi:hypothetical protein